jgi:cytochrome c
MNDRQNTIAGWILFGGIVALGSSIVAGEMFKSHAPEEGQGGYFIEGGAEDGGATGPAKPVEFYLQTADLAKGEASFKKCVACHTIDQGGANGIGPNLWATMGEPIGKGKGGYAFSPALSGHGGNWDWKSMDEWLAPKRFANGTKMSFAGLSDPQERANVIAFLNSKGSNLPIPAAPAEEAPAPAEGDNAAAPADANEAAPAEANAAAPAEANAAAPKP